MTALIERLRTPLTLAALLAALGFLFVQSMSLYEAQRQKIVQALQQLQRADAELAVDVLRLRTGLSRQYDSLNAGLGRLVAGLERLRAEGRRGAYGEAAPEIEGHLTRFARALTAAEEQLEQFKTDNAVLRNSILYFPVLQRELAAQVDPAWQGELGALANALLRFEQDPEGDAAGEAEALLMRLSDMPGSAALRAGVATLTAHARLVLSHGASADAALRNYMAAQPGEELRAVEQAYLVYYRRSQQRADLYRMLLFGVSLLLLAYLGYVMVRLNATAQGLRNSVGERVRAERLLQEMNQTLEQRVAERTTDLQALVREREAFSYSIAHDLRSPLGVISGFCHILRKDEEMRLSPEGRQMLQVIENNVAHLVALIDALLVLAQVSRVNLERKPVDLGQIAAAAAEALSLRYPQAHVELGALPQVSGDPTLITQALSNLLDNALKYSSREAAPQISVGWNSEAQACYVRDNGVGFDMRHAAKLFGAFERLHTDADFPGSGIGLAIVHRVVERHGGRVWADASPGAGATFYFSLEPVNVRPPMLDAAEKLYVRD